MDSRIRDEYILKYGELGAASLSVIKHSLEEVGNKSLAEEGFKGYVEISFDIESYDERKGRLRLVRQYEKFKEKNRRKK